MHKIEGPGATEDKRFTEGNPGSGVPATTLTAAFMNAIMDEIVHVIQAAGLTLQTEETETGSQLLAALGTLAPAQDIAVFDTAGTTSWAVPDVLKNGHRKACVTVIGAGGGAGRHSRTGGGGGGGGGIAHKIVDLTDVASVDVTVGSGGAGAPAGTTNANGSSGLSSSFGAHCSATGGQGGNNWLAGAGGSGTGGDINTGYGPGSNGIYNREGSTSPLSPGNGGGPGGLGSGSGTAGASGAAASIPGGGGGGGSGAGTSGGNSGAGGDGAPGIVIVRW